MSIVTKTELKEQITSVSSSKDGHVARWYFGGLASTGAVIVTHPLDTMKVYYQTSGQLPGSQGLISTTLRVIQTNGFLSLYNGISASMLRQMTYSTTRFGIYEVMKQRIVSKDETIPPLYKRVLLAGVSGAIGGLFGVPADIVNVRMQNDIKLPVGMKRNYGNAFRGIYIILQEEGIRAMFQGSSMALTRAVLVSIGQLAMYDQFKYFFVGTLKMGNDDVKTHILSATFSSITSTALAQPLDVLKTRLMNASGPGRQTVRECITEVYQTSGPLGFYKGFAPALIRLVPHTILVFVLFEQLRIRFGIEKNRN
ncbi:hypothetical protein RDWZM_004138 [Blomia tropicalis]|uniref:Mitochondrial dicarboxylate carrier n=1 Tax=Blomia tropicalis TaxID=40697 RepID=A0A9Q0RRI4_BLOTA|nr:hypothetical protein RDWZM_004138 [Blomia tropicalis]